MSAPRASGTFVPFSVWMLLAATSVLVLLMDMSCLPMDAPAEVRPLWTTYHSLFHRHAHERFGTHYEMDLFITFFISVSFLTSYYLLLSYLSTFWILLRFLHLNWFMSREKHPSLNYVDGDSVQLNSSVHSFINVVSSTRQYAITHLSYISVLALSKRHCRNFKKK